MKTPDLILLTGSKGAGKDTFAHIARRLRPGLVQSVAVADWFKALLAEATGFDPASFYDDRKEVPYRDPLLMNGSLQHKIQTILERDYYPWFGGTKENAVTDALRDHHNRAFTSNRKLMEWYGFEFIHALHGDDYVHCQILLQRAKHLLRGDPHCRYLIVTDARTHFESSYLAEVWTREESARAVKVRILGAREAKPDSGIEKAVTDGWPKGWFDAILQNREPSMTSMDEYQFDIKTAFEHLFP